MSRVRSFSNQFLSFSLTALEDVRDGSQTSSCSSNVQNRNSDSLGPPISTASKILRQSFLHMQNFFKSGDRSNTSEQFHGCTSSDQRHIFLLHACVRCSHAVRRFAEGLQHSMHVRIQLLSSLLFHWYRHWHPIVTRE